LEEGSFRGRTGDFFFLWLFCASFLVVTIPPPFFFFFFSFSAELTRFVRI
jgi:hypothetical protein